MEQVFSPEKVILFVGYGLREFELPGLSDIIFSA
jgi:hypothetical protein